MESLPLPSGMPHSDFVFPPLVLNMAHTGVLSLLQSVGHLDTSLVAAGPASSDSFLSSRHFTHMRFTFSLFALSRLRLVLLVADLSQLAASLSLRNPAWLDP